MDNTQEYIGTNAPFNPDSYKMEPTEPPVEPQSVVLSTEEYFSESGLYAEGKLKTDIIKLLDGFADLRVQQEREQSYTLQDMIDAVQYGFDYREISQNNGQNVPNGNVLQWLMGKKNLKEIPEHFKSFLNHGK